MPRIYSIRLSLRARGYSIRAVRYVITQKNSLFLSFPNLQHLLWSAAKWPICTSFMTRTKMSSSNRWMGWAASACFDCERVFRLRPGEVNKNVIFETLTRHETETVMIQRYIPAIEQGDKRVIIINGEVVPYSLARIPLAGETRGNLAAGGRGVAQPLTEKDREIAETLAPILSARGLFVVGLDIIGEQLTEINVTSPTCFVEIAEQTDFHVPNFFAQELERVVTAQS